MTLPMVNGLVTDQTRRLETFQCINETETEHQRPLALDALGMCNESDPLNGIMAAITSNSATQCHVFHDPQLSSVTEFYHKTFCPPNFLIMVEASDTLSSCRSNVPGEGCGGDFPRLTAGLCARCAHLETLAGDEIKYEQFVVESSSMPGVRSSFLSNAWTSMWYLPKHQEKSQVGKTVTDKVQEQSNAFNARITCDGAQPRSPARNPLTQINLQPTIPLNSEVIFYAKQASGASREAIVTVCMDVCHKGKIASAFGATTRSMAESVSITELHADAVSFVNKYWEKMHDQSLMCIYFNNVPKQYAKIKGKCICLELWISEDSSLGLIQMQDERRGNPNAHGQSWRRVISQNAHEYVTSGVLLSSGPMESSFVFAKCPALVPTESKDHVQLQLEKWVVVDQTGEVEIEWEHGTIPVEGDLARKPLARGKTKRVYTLNMNDKAYVAKRFINIGRGEEDLSVDDNRGWFWEQFKEEAKRQGREIATGAYSYRLLDPVFIDIDTDMQFVEPLLAKELVDDDKIPSLGSNCSLVNVEDSESQGIYWLLEERRTPVVNNYSYTLNHLHQKSLKGATIVAFTHFCWLYSKNTLVFADMQGGLLSSPSVWFPMIKICFQCSIEVLFDPMTHSPNGDTGLGDYGQEGIDVFLT
ncbi:hypothetical protein K439DRAFT_1617341 [Ramaria rubella]|nr:hypothetical protein K439DRAFT_1617341 [Ramaria rubella]